MTGVWTDLRNTTETSSPRSGVITGPLGNGFDALVEDL